MIPGTTSKLSESTVASATTIRAKTDVVRVTGSTAIANIIPNFGGGFGGICILIATDGAVATTTAGNIIRVASLAQNIPTAFIYLKSTKKWYPGAIS